MCHIIQPCGFSKMLGTIYTRAVILIHPNSNYYIALGVKKKFVLCPQIVRDGQSFSSGAIGTIQQNLKSLSKLFEAFYGETCLTCSFKFLLQTQPKKFEGFLTKVKLFSARRKQNIRVILSVIPYMASWSSL